MVADLCEELDVPHAILAIEWDLPPASAIQKQARAVRYGAAVAYFLDDHAFAEPAGFWVGGGQTTSVVVAPDGPASSVALSIRNGPTANDVAVANYRWRETLRLAPGEERIVKVPMNSARGAALVEVQSATGFRPVEGDTRFLGVFVRVD